MSKTMMIGRRPAQGSLAPWVAAVLVAFLVALKLFVLWLYGPTMTPDSSGYVAYADQILSGAFLHVDLAKETAPTTLARPIGYPAVVAAARLLAGTGFAYAVVLFQFAMSLWATVAVYRLARAFGLGVWLALAAAAAQATSIQFVLDQALLSDSLCASTLTLATCLLCESIFDGTPGHRGRLLSAGVLIAISFLMRDVIAFIAVGFVPLAAAAAWGERSRPGKIIAFALVFLPLVVAHRACIEFNRWRAGAPVVTTVSQWTLTNALGAASRFDPTIFSGADPFDSTSRDAFKNFGLAEELREAFVVNDVLHRDFGWTGPQIAQAATTAYLRAWVHHPMAMIRHTLDHFSETQLHQAVRPTETIRDVLLWNTGSEHEFGRERAVINGNWWMIPAVIASRLSETASVLVFVAFLVGAPWRLWCEPTDAAAIAGAGLWCAYMVCGGLYAAVHLEPRYLAPVVAGSIVVGVAVLVWLIDMLGRAAGKSTAQPQPPGGTLSGTS